MEGFTPEEEKALAEWIEKHPATVGSGLRPATISGYVRGQLRRKMDADNLVAVLMDFLGSSTNIFVEDLFKAIKSKSFAKEPTPEPTPVSTSEPTPEPTSEPTPEPTPVPRPQPPHKPRGPLERNIVFITYLSPENNSVIRISQQFEKLHFGRITAIEERPDLNAAFVEFANFYDAHRAVNMKKKLFGNQFIQICYAQDPDPELLAEFEEEKERRRKAHEEKQKQQQEAEEDTDSTTDEEEDQ